MKTLRLKEENVNKYADEVYEFGTKYEKMQAKAFCEINENVATMKEAIESLYHGPESFVEVAEQDLQQITNNFKQTTNSMIEQLNKTRKTFFILCGVAVGITCLICLFALLFLFFSAGIQDFFINTGKQWSPLIVFLIVIIAIAVSSFITYCVTKRKGW